MPAPIAWSAKHVPDPEHPGYVKVAGSYAHDFIQWAKMFGNPDWSPQGKACILGRQIETRAAHVRKLGDDEFEMVDSGCRFRLYWPLAVLEPIFESMLKRESFCYVNLSNEMICKAP
jgi:hypothetical protein